VSLRIGQGIDFHRFIAPGDHIVLGGVKIPYHHKLEGHSDADVLTHAVMDAILGAAGMPDIGQLFPNTDQSYRGISSLKLLEEVMQKISCAGWKVINCDCTIVSEAPKINPYSEAIKKNLSEHLKVYPTDIGIKATTSENMGALGRSEGMMASCVVLLQN
jgi:2-C-methyl-D-erythritol 2,4-cyclodiphosphate synthase